MKTKTFCEEVKTNDLSQNGMPKPVSKLDQATQRIEKLKIKVRDLELKQQGIDGLLDNFDKRVRSLQSQMAALASKING